MFITYYSYYCGGGAGIGLFVKQGNSADNIDLLETFVEREKEVVSLNLSGEKAVIESARGPVEKVTEVTHQIEHIKQKDQAIKSTEGQSISSEQIKDEFIIGQDEGIGNCIVIENDSEVIGKLEQGITYFSVACDNSQVVDVELESWTGIFPSFFFKNIGKGLKLGNKFNINVSYQDVSEDYEGEESYQTLFTSDRFASEKIIGRWGNNLEYTNDELNVVYKVEVSDLETSSNFYISKKV